MTLHSENAMARFLFAILKQKNLKDIDWNKVASDPVLLEPISNGHAARMRYSRFRATVTANTPRDASRVTKPKRRTKLVKPETSPSLDCYDQFSPASTSNTSPYLGETPDDLTSRFLTPCSDDMGLVVSGESDQRLRSVPLFPPFEGVMDHQHSLAFDAGFALGRYGVGGMHGLKPSGLVDPYASVDCAQEWNGSLYDDCQF